MLKKIILGLIVLVVLVIVYNLLTQIMTAVKSGERLSAAAEAVFKLEVKNKELKQKFAQVQSPQFIEEQARNKLGFGRAGETMLIIPKEKIKLILGASSSAQIKLPNWLGWFRVFFH